MATNYCPQCGEAVGAGDRFCPACGTTLAGDEAAGAGRPAASPSRLPVAIGVLAAIGVILIIAGFFLQSDEPAAVVEPPAVPETARPENQLPFPNVARMAVTEAAPLQMSGEAIFVDVREPDDFAEAHIPDARSIPLGETALDPAYETLPPDATIVTYCT